jgi:hypothetical protein
LGRLSTGSNALGKTWRGGIHAAGGHIARQHVAKYCGPAA